MIKFDILGGLSIETITKLLAQGYYVSMFNRMDNVCEICFTKNELHIAVYTFDGKAAEGMVEFRPKHRKSKWKCIALGDLQFELFNEEKLFELIRQSEECHEQWLNNNDIDISELIISDNLISLS